MLAKVSIRKILSLKTDILSSRTDIKRRRREECHRFAVVYGYPSCLRLKNNDALNEFCQCCI